MSGVKSGQDMLVVAAWVKATRAFISATQDLLGHGIWPDDEGQIDDLLVVLARACDRWDRIDVGPTQ